MKQFFDFLPLVVFFVIYKIHDIYYASGAMLVASALLLIYNLLRFRQIGKFSLINFFLVAICSSLTLYYHNAEFIKWKITIIYILLAAGLLISQCILGKPLIQQILDKKIHFPERIWNNLNIAWAVFFLACSAANTYIAFWLPQDVWVAFKVFGLTGLTLLCTIFSSIYIYCHIKGKNNR